MLQKFLYEKPCHSCVAHAQDALRPAWRSPPCADGGENRLVGCAGELPAFCCPAGPRARPVSRAAAYGATRPWRHCAIALQPTWRGPPRVDCGEHGLVGCAVKLLAFCRPPRPRARPASRAAAYGAALPLRRRRAAEARGQAPCPAPPTLCRARSARPVSGPILGAQNPAPLLGALGGAPRCCAPGWLPAQPGSWMPPLPGGSCGWRRRGGAAAAAPRLRRGHGRAAVRRAAAHAEQPRPASGRTLCQTPQMRFVEYPKCLLRQSK
jgi:hypothetical protein